jgi:hypothetical protein
MEEDWIFREGKFYCCHCVPTAKTSVPDKAELKVSGQGYCGVFTDIKALFKHLAECQRQPAVELILIFRDRKSVAPPDEADFLGTVPSEDDNGEPTEEDLQALYEKDEKELQTLGEEDVKEPQLKKYRSEPELL